MIEAALVLLKSLTWQTWLVVGLAVAGAAVYGEKTARVNTLTHQLETSKAEVATVRGQWAMQVAEGASAAAAATEKNRLITAALQKTKDEADHVHQTDQAASVRAAAAFAAERTGLRNQLAAYAAGPADRGGLSLDTVVACHQRATALGSGLDSSLQAEEDLTDDLEHSRADTRNLLHAWPVKGAP